MPGQWALQRAQSQFSIEDRLPPILRVGAKQTQEPTAQMPRGTGVPTDQGGHLV